MSVDKQKLERTIARATEIIYSEQCGFDDAVAELVEKNHASAVEAFVALRAAASTKGGGTSNLELSLATLEDAIETKDPELNLLRFELLKSKAQQDFLTIQMANEFLKLEDVQSFGGAVYQAEKVKKGPLTKEEREQLWLRYYPTR